MQRDKSEFLCKEVGFLARVITSQGIKSNPSKIKAVREYPLLKTVKEIKSFFGFCRLLQKIHSEFRKNDVNIYGMLKERKKINPDDTEYIEAFRKCKELLTNAPVLAYPDVKNRFHLTADASNTAIGSVLSQNNHPIVFYFRTLNSIVSLYCIQ